MINRSPDFFKLFSNHIIVLDPKSMEWELLPKGDSNTATTSKIDLSTPLNLSKLVQDYIKQNYRVILTGGGGCGKNYAKDLLVNAGFIYGPSYASRKIREGEVDGTDYHFISKDKFEAMIDNGEFYEYVEFGGKYYGTTNEQFLNNCNLFIMTAGGIDKIKSIDRERTIVIYFDIPTSVLLKRLTGGRGDSNEAALQRMEDDRIEFDGWDDWDLKITDEQFTIESLIYNLENTILNIQ